MLGSRPGESCEILATGQKFSRQGRQSFSRKFLLPLAPPSLFSLSPPTPRKPSLPLLRPLHAKKLSLQCGDSILLVCREPANSAMSLNPPPLLLSKVMQCTSPYRPKNNWPNRRASDVFTLGAYD